MMAWELWKQGFDAWENATAEYLENVLKNESVLGPAGAMLTMAMKTKAATDNALAAWWGAMGLPTKRDQERGLHKLNQIESRLLDLEEMLEDVLEADAPADLRADGGAGGGEAQQEAASPRNGAKPDESKASARP